MRPSPLRTPFVPVQNQCLLPPPQAPTLTTVPHYPRIPSHSVSFKLDLPDVSKIPTLSSGADWPLWFCAISDMIDNLCLYHHICPELAPGIFLNTLSAPSFPPVLHEGSSSDEVALHAMWWRADGTVWHILCGHLSPGPDAMVPPRRDGNGILRVTSHDLFAILLCHYGGGDHGSASVIKQHIRGLVCRLGKDAMTSYVMDWRGALH
jgi:hypothetical protein